MTTNLHHAGLLLLTILCSAQIASAHHGTATARVAGSRAALDAGASLSPEQLPRVTVGLSTDSSYFGRAMRGSEADSRAPLGSVLRNGTALTLGFDLSSLTRLSATLPFAVVTLNPDGEASRTLSGLGDLRLSGRQVLTFDFAPLPGLRLSFGGSVTAPTGEYRSNAGLELLEVAPGEAGALEVVSYYSQASIGSGAWAGAGSLQLSWQPWPRVVAQLSGDTSLFFSDTVDNVNWGTDSQISGLVRVSPSFEAVEVLAGLNFLRHSKDRVVNEFGAQRVGGRSQFAVQLGLRARVHRKAQCGADLQLPLWQYASGIQLMETMSASLGCTWTSGL